MKMQYVLDHVFLDHEKKSIHDLRERMFEYNKLELSTEYFSNIIIRYSFRGYQINTIIFYALK